MRATPSASQTSARARRARERRLSALHTEDLLVSAGGAAPDAPSALGSVDTIDAPADAAAKARSGRRRARVVIRGGAPRQPEYPAGHAPVETPASTSPSRSSSRSVRRRRGARSADPSAARRCVIRGDCSLNISQRRFLRLRRCSPPSLPRRGPPRSLPRALRRRVFLLGFRASSERLLRETHPDPRSLRSPRSRPVFVLLFQSVSAFSAPEAGERVSTSRAPLQPRRLLRLPRARRRLFMFHDDTFLDGEHASRHLVRAPEHAEVKRRRELGVSPQRKPRQSASAELARQRHTMEYASQYRSCAHTRSARSVNVRGRPSASTSERASSDAAAGMASAATAHPYDVRNDGVKKNKTHPTIGSVVLSSARLSAALARANPDRRSAHAKERSVRSAVASRSRLPRSRGFATNDESGPADFPDWRRRRSPNLPLATCGATARVMRTARGSWET